MLPSGSSRRQTHFALPFFPCVLGIEYVTFLVSMSSWEKWVFPQEVNAFPSPSFFFCSPSPWSLQSHSPSNLSFCLIFPPLFLTSSTPRYSAKQCSLRLFLHHPCETSWSNRRRTVKNTKGLVIIFICLALDPDGDCLITDSCSKKPPKS